MAASMKLMFPAISASLSVDQVNEEAPRSYQKYILNQLNLSQHQKCILIGEHGSGKTALLFQCAVSLAQDGRPVTFITPTKFQSLPPAVEGASPSNPLLLKQINIMYFQDRPSLLAHLSAIHTQSPLPHAILIDNLDYYTSHPQIGDIAANASLLCAYLVDAVTFVASKRSQKAGMQADDCLLMASVSCSAQGEFQLPHVYRNFFTSELRIAGVESQDSIFQLTSYANGTAQSDCIVTYKLGSTIKMLDILMGEEAGAFSQLTSDTQNTDGNG